MQNSKLSIQNFNQGEFRYLTLRRGIRYEQNWIEWCDEVLAFLSEEENESKINSKFKIINSKF
ncbi:MAG: hypothetical protein J7647_09250 [Cyanobacteria bacterium SBLK]|nr:hypothetical protein [Cyanobacteria bacterium SBLK]